VFWGFTRPDRATLAAAAVLLVLAAGTDTVAVWLFSEIVDGLVRGTSTDGGLSGYAGPAALWAGTAVLGALASFAGSYLTARAAENFVLRLRDRAFGQLQRLGPGFHADHPVGDLQARLSADVELIESMVSSGPVQLVVAALSVLMFAGAAFWIRWDLALVVTVLLPLLWLATRRFSRRLGELSHHERAGNGEISTAVGEAVSTIALARAYREEAREAERVHRAGRHWRGIRLAESRLMSVYTPLTDLFQTLGVLAVLGAGSWEIAMGRLTVGGLVGFATYLGFLFSPLQQLGELVLTMSEARAGATRVAELLDARPAVVDRPAAVAVPPATGELAVHRVGFGYPGSGRIALREVSFTARPGELILVTGPSGAGKSTLAGLLLRFHDPIAGRITLDGVDLRDYRLDALRAAITWLPQDSTLVTGTVADNIAYGSPGATPNQVMAAARAAGADSFIGRLPQGYLTALRHPGTELSGGQRQRIALARAFLRDTPLLVLDEPSTGLDPRAVAALLGPLRALANRRTTILISHDIAFADIADRVLRLAPEQATNVVPLPLAHAAGQ
jgi:ATP-binding cassette subfamily B protein